MLKSSLLDILRTFSKQELIKFEDFVRSPYFNKKEIVTSLFLEIKKYAPVFEGDDLGKENIWKKLFPGKDYNYGIMKNLIFDLNKLAEEFIASLKYNADEYTRKEYLLNALFDRELLKIYINKHNAFDSEPDLNFLNVNNLEIDDYLHFMSKMYHLKLHYHHQFDRNFKIENLQFSCDSYQVSYFLMILFGSYMNAEVNERDRNLDPGRNPATKILDLISPGLEIIAESIASNTGLNSHYIKIAYFTYLTYRDKTESRYKDLKKIVFENLNILPKFNQQNYHYALIGTLFKIKNHKLNINKEVVEILDSLIENKIFTSPRNEIVPIHIFHLYIGSCFTLGDAEKIVNFASKFISKLDIKHAEDSKTFVNFMISFINKDFMKALNYISLLNIPYSLHKNTLKKLKAMCIYEISDYEMFLNEYDSLKHYIKNNNIGNSSILKLNKHFSAIKQLFHLKHDFDEYKFLELKEFIIESFEDSNPWFNEKLDEIKKANFKKDKSLP
ncbi:MAG TPA: hypothetical protein PKD83_07690 [Ignavibacteria bacterium]|nr:hypothetical protein [Ignavibacteria bacterium]